MWGELILFAEQVLAILVTTYTRQKMYHHLMPNALTVRGEDDEGGTTDEAVQTINETDLFRVSRFAPFQGTERMVSILTSPKSQNTSEETIRAKNQNKGKFFDRTKC